MTSSRLGKIALWYVAGIPWAIAVSIGFYLGLDALDLGSPHTPLVWAVINTAGSALLVVAVCAPVYLLMIWLWLRVSDRVRILESNAVVRTLGIGILSICASLPLLMMEMANQLGGKELSILVVYDWVSGSGDIVGLILLSTMAVFILPRFTVRRLKGPLMNSP